MHKERTVKFLLCLSLLLALPAAAQQTISSERPSFSSSPVALAAGLWQLEGGFLYSRFNSDVDGYSLPLALLRYGAGERAEIQVSWPGYSRFDVGPGNVDGFTDLSVGVKWQVSDDGASTPIALFAGLSLPVGGNEFSSDELDPSIGLFWAHEGRVSLFGTVLFSDTGDDTALGNGLGINLPVGDACGGCGVFVEYVGIFPEDGGPQHSLNAGVAWLRADNLQFDVNLGLGINDRAGDGSLGFGAAYRF